MPALTADEIVLLLALQPHPEGGAYRETFRDTVTVDGSASARAVSTAIYFLLRRGEVSRWHRIDASEVWHWYAGAPLLLSVADEADGKIGRRHDLTLGCELAQGERPQAIVPPGFWQQARTLGDWTLVGCTVAPGFLFEHFEMAPEDFDRIPAVAPPT